MAGKDIKAGRAYVEVGGRDKLTGMLKGVARRAGAFAKMLGTAAVTGIGAMAVAGAAAVKTFANMGSELADMSARTGVSVEALSELRYAAEQTGAGAEALETGIRKMQKTIVDAGQGSKESAESLADLGLTFGDLRDLSPEDQFKLIASRLRDIPDRTARAAVAMKVLGKSGTALLPMVQDLDALTSRARALGLVISGDDAEAADRFGDLLDDLWKVIKQGVFVIGGGLTPVLETLVNGLVNATAASTRWLKTNRGSITAWAQLFSDSIAWVVAQFGTFARMADEALGGALGTLMSGDFKAAGDIAVTQLKIAWLGLKDWFSELWTDIGNGMVAAQINAIAGSKSAWVKFMGWHKSLTTKIGDGAVNVVLEAEEFALREALKAETNPARKRALNRQLAENEARQQNVKEIAGTGEQEIDGETQGKLDAIEKQRKADLAAAAQIASKGDPAEKERLGNEVARLQAEAAQARQQAASAAKRRNEEGRADAALDGFYGPVEKTRQVPPVDPDEVATSIKDSVRDKLEASRGTFNATALEGLMGGKEDEIAKNTRDTAMHTKTLANGLKFTYQS